MAFQVVLEFRRLDMIKMYFVRVLLQQILLALSSISGPACFVAVAAFISRRLFQNYICLKQYCIQ